MQLGQGVCGLFYLGLIALLYSKDVQNSKCFVETNCVIYFSRWSNLAKFLPLVQARIVSGHLTESGQFFEKCKSFNFSLQVR
jgi:hypothetical protein